MERLTRGSFRPFYPESQESIDRLVENGLAAPLHRHPGRYVVTPIGWRLHLWAPIKYHDYKLPAHVYVTDDRAYWWPRLALLGSFRASPFTVITNQP